MNIALFILQLISAVSYMEKNYKIIINEFKLLYSENNN